MCGDEYRSGRHVLIWNTWWRHRKAITVGFLRSLLYWSLGNSMSDWTGECRIFYA